MKRIMQNQRVNGKISLKKRLLSRDLNNQKRPYSQQKEQEAKKLSYKKLT